MLFSLLAGCGHPSDEGTIPHERFVALYADMLFIGELHRLDTLSYRRAFDSLARANGVDTARISMTVSWYASRPEKLTSLYEESILLLESRADTTKAR